MVRKAGFMLLELLIAAAALSCAAGVLVAYQTQTALAQREVKHRMRALSYAVQLLEQKLYTSYACAQVCDDMTSTSTERVLTPSVSAEPWIELHDAQMVEIVVTYQLNDAQKNIRLISARSAVGKAA